MIIPNFEELIKCDPEALSTQGCYYLERPKDGWKSYGGSSGFLGVGYHGTEVGYFEEDWSSCEPTGHIPSGGYG